jgi:cytochrome c553
MISKAILTALGGFLLFAGPVHAGDATAGKAKAEDCAGCHGDDGKGDENTPGIAGMAELDFVKAMNEYKSGVRTKSKGMNRIAKGLSDDDIANLAAYYASLH